MTRDLTGLEEQLILAEMQTFMDRPVIEYYVPGYYTWATWLSKKFNEGMGWNVAYSTYLNYAECFWFANGIHPHS